MPFKHYISGEFLKRRDSPYWAAPGVAGCARCAPPGPGSGPARIRPKPGWAAPPRTSVPSYPSPAPTPGSPTATGSPRAWAAAHAYPAPAPGRGQKCIHVNSNFNNIFLMYSIHECCWNGSWFFSPLFIINVTNIQNEYFCKFYNWGHWKKLLPCHTNMIIFFSAIMKQLFWELQYW